MVSKLYELYPSYYDRITALFHDKNLLLSPCGFINRSNTSSKQTDEQGNTHLQRLKYAANQCPPDVEKEICHHDFDLFYSQLTTFLKKDLPASFLCERDLAAQRLYRDLCTVDRSDVFNQTLIRYRETIIIESAFNWSGLFNKYYRVGTGYYSSLPVRKGRFYNLVTPEASDNGFTLHDINEVERFILQFLSNPQTIHELLIQLQSNFEEDMLQNHYELYENLILMSIKQLVLKKTIQYSKSNNPTCEAVK